MGLQLVIFFGINAVGGSQQRKLSEKIAGLASVAKRPGLSGHPSSAEPTAVLSVIKK